MTKRSPSRATTGSARATGASARAKQTKTGNGRASGTRAQKPQARSRSKASVPADPGPSVRVIAVANQKGGVGKSTTAVSLGASLAELGRTVLVVDLDPQGNASTGLGIRHEAREVTVYDVLAAEAPIAGAIVTTPVPNLFAIPSTIDLAGAEIELVSQFSRELRLRKAIEPLKQGGYDYILLDCPPSLGLLTVNALAAAEELIVPIQCEYYALEGLGQLLRNVRLVQQNVNPSLHLTGIVMTMYDPRTRLSEQVVQEVRRYFGERVYDTVIPRTVRLSEAPGFGQPITVYDPKSRGAESYRELAREVAAKLPSAEPLPVIDELPTVVVSPPEAHPMTAPHPLREARPVEPEEEAEELGAGPALEPEAIRAAPSPLGPEVDSPATAIEPEAARSAAGEPEPLLQVEAVREYTSEVVEPIAVETAVEVEPQWNAEEVPVEAEVETYPAEGSPVRSQPEYRSMSESAPAADPRARLAALEAQAQAEAEGAPEEAEPPVSVETLLEAEPGPEDRAEAGEVVVIRDRDAAGDHSIGAEVEGEGDEAGGKRRWGLFRRGGGR